jgi:hypothetical protein
LTLSSVYTTDTTVYPEPQLQTRGFDIFHKNNSNLPTIDWACNNLTATGTVSGTTAILTNLTANRIPHHTALGLVNSPITVSGNDISVVGDITSKETKLLKNTTLQIDPPGSGNTQQIDRSNSNNFIIIPAVEYDFSISFASDIPKGHKIDMIIIAGNTGNITLISNNSETYHGDVDSSNKLLLTPGRHNRVIIESLTATGNIFWVTIHPTQK